MMNNNKICLIKIWSKKNELIQLTPIKLIDSDKKWLMVSSTLLRYA